MTEQQKELINTFLTRWPALALVAWLLYLLLGQTGVITQAMDKQQEIIEKLAECVND